MVTLRDDLATSIGADKASLDIAGQTLVAIHDWTFLSRAGILRRRQRHPARLAHVPHCFSVPEGAFEAAFAIYLIVKGFRPSPILDDARFTGGDGGSLRPAAAP